jgi:hypothetical protein
MCNFNGENNLLGLIVSRMVSGTEQKNSTSSFFP